MPRPTTIRDDVQFALPDGWERQEPLQFVTTPTASWLTGAALGVAPIQVPKYYETMGPQAIADPTNLVINEGGKIESRIAVRTVGATSAFSLIHATTYKAKDGTDYLLRWGLSAIEKNSGSGWTAITGPGFGNAQFIFTTVWGEKLLFSDSLTGVYEVDVPAGTYTKLSNAPVCRAITTFGGRLVASCIGTSLGQPVNPSRIQWTVKNNNNDWSGTGSGFEDLIAGPGGVSDRQLGVFPINDTEALVVRQGTVWILVLTGDVNAPFDFRFLYKTQINAERSLAAAPYGVYCLGYSGVYLLTTGAPEEITFIDSRSVLSRSTTFDYINSVGAYDQFRDTYYLMIPVVASLISDGISTLIFRYNRHVKIWTRDLIKAFVSSISSANYKFTSDVVRGIIISTYKASTGAGRVLVESQGSTTDHDEDGNSFPILTQFDVYLAPLIDEIIVYQMAFDLSSGTASSTIVSIVGFISTAIDTGTQITLASGTYTRPAIQRERFFVNKVQTFKRGVVLRVSLTNNAEVQFDGLYIWTNIGAPLS